MSILLSYSKNQKHKRPILDYQGEALKLNRSCGDSCKIRVSLNPFDVGYEADGCSVHLASIEIASEMCLERTKEQAREWVRGVLQDLEQGKDTHDDPRLFALFEIRSFPVRRKCVLLAWQTLYEALDSAGA
jgi:NifU-like protein involved in Fe-S cluster formation